MEEKVLTKSEINEIIELSIATGRIMLENGAETYRVEDTITRLCDSRGLYNINTFVVPTGIFVSGRYNKNVYSYIERTRVLRTDLHVIDLINDFSRQFVTSSESVDSALEKLEDIKNSPSYSKLTRSFFAGIASGFFAVIFGSNGLEFVLAFITSFMLIYILDTFEVLGKSFFIKNVCGGMINTTIAIALVAAVGMIGFDARLDQIIIGSIMPLVPGVAFTNAIRDSISGDFVSGSSKLLEAIVIALGIAIGVGVILNINYFILGGI